MRADNSQIMADNSQIRANNSQISQMRVDILQIRASLMALQQNSTSEGAVLSLCLGGLKGAIDSMARDVSELKAKL